MDGEKLLYFGETIHHMNACLILEKLVDLAAGSSLTSSPSISSDGMSLSVVVLTYNVDVAYLYFIQICSTTFHFTTILRQIFFFFFLFFFFFFLLHYIYLIHLVTCYFSDYIKV